MVEADRAARRVAVVGAEAAKFTPETEADARRIIRQVLHGADELVSGGCHLGGIDIWAEEEADRLGVSKNIFLPARLGWHGGFRVRNLQIARRCTELHVIVVREYPPGFQGRRFEFCYHCKTDDHVKSGGCWTGWQAYKLGKPVKWHIVGG